MPSCSHFALFASLSHSCSLYWSKREFMISEPGAHSRASSLWISHWILIFHLLCNLPMFLGIVPFHRLSNQYLSVFSSFYNWNFVTLYTSSYYPCSYEVSYILNSFENSAIFCQLKQACSKCWWMLKTKEVVYLKENLRFKSSADTALRVEMLTTYLKV